jgi:hypothetical protein
MLGGQHNPYSEFQSHVLNVANESTSSVVCNRRSAGYFLWPATVFQHTDLIPTPSHPHHNEGQLLSPLVNFTSIVEFSKQYSSCGGRAVAQLVEALRYKPERRGFDSRWCHWN